MPEALMAVPMGMPIPEALIAVPIGIPIPEALMAVPIGIPIPEALMEVPIYGCCGYENDELLLRGYPVGLRDDP